METVETLFLRFTKGEAIPTVGNKVIVHGMAGAYLVHIRQVVSQRESQEDGPVYIHLKVLATRQLMNPSQAE